MSNVFLVLEQRGIIPRFSSTVLPKLFSEEHSTVPCSSENNLGNKVLEYNIAKLLKRGIRPIGGVSG